MSVVIPTIPTNSHKQIVDNLREQTFDTFEVLVVNDGTLDICEARNVGIEKANADIVALTDDDCRPPRNWLERIVKTFNQRPDLACLEGAIHGGRRYDGSQKYVGCNLAFDREAALAVGGFDSTFAGWRDDTEFGWRMERNASGKCIFRAEVAMNHPEKPRASIDDAQEAELRDRYPDRYDEIIIPDTYLERVNDWLWRRGFWDAVDQIRT
ncbi:family 2 glycosyl transferase [Halobacteriales archaeon QS_6_71_20]|nr:MAG: family 2 glycosyl transferase [Halobacteriales archaeon QS_6_71_20]